MLFFLLSLFTIEKHQKRRIIMNRIKTMLKQAINNNRKEWLALITYGYNIESKSAWQYLGYQSKNAYFYDLKENLHQLPTTLNNH
ncbi:hypothetical protein VFFQA001_10130 [Aliivibrio fischeri]|nr:hypothetical protein VFFQA001_10130 [Aliivibrio fischeri]